MTIIDVCMMGTENLPVLLSHPTSVLCCSQFTKRFKSNDRHISGIEPIQVVFGHCQICSWRISFSHFLEYVDFIPVVWIFQVKSGRSDPQPQCTCATHHCIRNHSREIYDFQCLHAMIQHEM